MNSEQKPKLAQSFFYDGLQPEEAKRAFSNQRKIDLDAYVNRNGPYLKQQHLDQAQELSLNQAELTEIERDWRDAIADRRDVIRARVRGDVRELNVKRKAIVESVVADYMAAKSESEPEDEEQKPVKGQLVPITEPEPEPETRPIFTPKGVIKLNRQHAVISNLG